MTSPPPPVPTEALNLAKEYLRLGGKRLSVNDDNIVSTREWEHDSAEAKSFWERRIETLPMKEKAEVISHLPTVSAV